MAELRSRFGRHLALFEPQLRLAEAWLAAAQGNVSAAIELALHAGDMAKRSGQRAIELRALHNAIRFGDRPRCSARSTSPPVSVGGWRPSTVRTPPRWPTATPPRCTRRPNGSSGSARCSRPPTPPPTPPFV